MIYYLAVGFQREPPPPILFISMSLVSHSAFWRRNEVPPHTFCPLAGCGKKELATKTQGTKIPKGLFAWFLDRDLRVFVTLWLAVSFSAGSAEYLQSLFAA
jgi:hypothetical protein